VVAPCCTVASFVAFQGDLRPQWGEWSSPRWGEIQIGGPLTRQLSPRRFVSAMTVLSWCDALVGLLATLNWAKTPSRRLQLV
jgi:hypothetical protein